MSLEKTLGFPRRFHNPEVEGSIPSITTNHHLSPVHMRLGFFVAQKQQMSRKCYAFDLYQARKPRVSLLSAHRIYLFN